MPSSKLATMDVTVRKSALGRRSFRSPFHALFTMGQVRPMLARASKEVKFAMVPAIRLPGDTRVADQQGTRIDCQPLRQVRCGHGDLRLLRRSGRMTRTVRNHSVTSQNHVRPLCQLLTIHLRRIVTEQHTLRCRALPARTPRRKFPPAPERSPAVDRIHNSGRTRRSAQTTCECCAPPDFSSSPFAFPSLT